jgi:hypothetical protein
MLLACFFIFIDPLLRTTDPVPKNRLSPPFHPPDLGLKPIAITPRNTGTTSMETLDRVYRFAVRDD